MGEIGKTCPKCGKKYAEEDSFCLQCGEKLISATAVQETKKSANDAKKCPKCSTNCDKTAVFCSSCGYRFNGVNKASNASIVDKPENHYKKVCTKCGESYKGSVGESTCRNCGGRLVSVSTDRAYASNKGVDFSKVIKILAVCLLILIFIPTIKVNGWNDSKQYSIGKTYWEMITDKHASLDFDEVLIILFLFAAPIVLLLDDLATYPACITAMVSGGAGFLALRMFDSQIVERYGLGLVHTSFLFTLFEIGYIAVIVLVGVQMYSDWQRAQSLRR